MTERKEKILEVALQLFADHGYASTSTSKIAKAAGVSEALIFRHFKSKEGLLQAIMDQGKERSLEIYKDLLNEKDPAKVVVGFLKIPFEVSPEEYDYWKLIYGLKWQTGKYIDTISSPVKEILIKAFSDLNYQDPVAEAELLISIIDGTVTAILIRKVENADEILEALLKKYVHRF